MKYIITSFLACLLLQWVIVEENLPELSVCYHKVALAFSLNVW